MESSKEYIEIVHCSVMQCQAIDNTLQKLPVNVHVVVHRSQAGANPSGRNAVD